MAKLTKEEFRAKVLEEMRLRKEALDAIVEEEDVCGTLVCGSAIDCSECPYDMLGCDYER